MYFFSRAFRTQWQGRQQHLRIPSVLTARQSHPEAQEDERHPATAAQPLPVLAGLHHPTHGGGFCDVGLHPLLA